MLTLSLAERALCRPFQRELPRTIALIEWWQRSSGSLNALTSTDRWQVTCHVNEWVEFVAWAHEIALGDDIGISADRDRYRQLDAQLETIVLSASIELFEAYRLYVLDQQIDDSLQDRKLRAVAFFYQSAAIRRLMSATNAAGKGLELPPHAAADLTRRGKLRQRFPVLVTQLIGHYLESAGNETPEETATNSELMRESKLLSFFCRWLIRRRQLAISRVSPSAVELQSLDLAIRSLQPEELLAYARWLTGPRRQSSTAASKRSFVTLMRFIRFLIQAGELPASVLEEALPGTLQELHWCDFHAARFRAGTAEKPQPLPCVLFPVEPVEKTLDATKLTQRSREQARITLWHYVNWLANRKQLTLRRHVPIAVRKQLAATICSATPADVAAYRAHVIANPTSVISNTRNRLAMVKSFYARLKAQGQIAADPAAAVSLIGSAELRPTTKQREHNRQLNKRVRPGLRILKDFHAKNISPLWDFLWWWSEKQKIDLTPPLAPQTEAQFENSFKQLTVELLLEYRERLRDVRVPGTIVLQQLKLRLAVAFAEWLVERGKVRQFSRDLIPILCKTDFRIKKIE